MAVIEPVIATQKLSKRYAGAADFALKDLSIKIMPGEVYGFLGPNGAGKSTAIRLLMNFIQPTAGTAEILGKDIVTESTQIKAAVGYLSGDITLYSKMTGRQFLTYMNELQPPKRSSYYQELAKLFNADLKPRIGNLSKGNRQKIGVIQAFMHEPDVLILDEPTGGLDPLMQEAFFDLVRKTKDRGASLFISSHNLTEVQKMCDRVGFIRSGKLVGEQTIAKLTAQASQTFDVSFAHEVPLAELKRIPRIKVTQNSTHHVSVHVHGSLPKLFEVLARHQVNGITQREANLENEFLAFYKEDKDETAN